MSDLPESPPASRKPRKRAQSPIAAEAPEQAGKVAKILTLVGNVKAKGFTFGPKQTVPGVPLAHAEFLKAKGEAEILEVS